MTDDPIVEEIRAIRHRLSAEFDHDLERIAEDILRRQKESGRTYVRLPARRVKVAKADEE